MFNWWMARPAGGNREDENAEIEPPETPAPVFAARAIKSAIFGTPAPPDDESFLEPEKAEHRDEIMSRMRTRDLQAANISPTKPQGILLTPGTATSRRKTVSFGQEVLEKAEKSANEDVSTKTSIRKRHSSTEGKSDQTSKSTRLTRALESVREESAARTQCERRRGSFESQPLLNLHLSTEIMEGSKDRGEVRPAKSHKTNLDLMEDFLTGEPANGDVTMDLNEPHSQSGKYWKSEFEQYHDEARAEVKKLTKYKILAKSYAKKKDAEAAELGAKLKEEQGRVLDMEEKITKLSAKIASSGANGQEQDSPMLIKELARQTAMAVQYRAQVEEFRAALEGDDAQVVRSGEVQTLLETQRELKKARDQIKEMEIIHDDIRGFKKRLSVAEQNAKKLEEDNTKLTHELLHADLRLEKEIEKSEKRRQASHERLQKKDEALQTLQKDYDSLKEAAKSQRRDAEQLLKKRHDQVEELKKELALRKSAETTAKDLQQALEAKTVEYNKIISDYQRQIARLINTQSEDLLAAKLPMKDLLPEAAQVSKMVMTNTENSHLRDSQIPILSSSITRPVKTLATSKTIFSENHTGASGSLPLSSHSALSEITNVEGSERRPREIPSSTQYTPLARRFSNLSLEAPDVELPSPGPSVLSQPPSHAFHQRICQPSPRPSMFVIPSSPPKRKMTQTRTSTELSRQRSTNTLTNASSRLASLENSRTKSSLPPERAAAAKARLEQKNAEKKKAQGLGTDKENIRN